MADLKNIKNKYLSSSDGEVLGINTNKDRIGFLARKLATAQGLVGFDTVNAFSDSYSNDSGINTGASSYYRGTNMVQNPRTGSNYFGNGELGTCQFSTGSITQSGHTRDVDEVLSEGDSVFGMSYALYNARDRNAGGAQDNSPLPTSSIYGAKVLNDASSGTSGDMAVLNFKDLTIDASTTLTTAIPCRGLLVYVDGNLTVNGHLSMTGRGGNANPTSAGGSDNAAVSATGLRIPMFTSGGGDSLSAADFAGTGNAGVAAVANHPAISSNGTIFTVSQLGGAGGAALQGVPAGNGNAGTAGSTGAATISTGGGGSGAVTQGWPTTGTSGAGGAGGAFSAGAGGGHTQCRPGPCSASGGGNYGSSGGNTGASGGSMTGYGGTGNLEGEGWFAASADKRPANDGARGVGGLMWIIVNGNVTIASGGTIQSTGAMSQGNSYGGGSGGGAIFLLHSGTFTNNGSFDAGAGSTGSPGGNGGVGGKHSAQVSAPVNTNAFTLQSAAQTAKAQPDNIRIAINFEKVSGAVSLNTDIVASVSRNGGSNFTTATLVDKGDYDTGKQVLVDSVDVSGQPSGTSIVYKIVSANSKQFKIHGTTVSWS